MMSHSWKVICFYLHSSRQLDFLYSWKSFMVYMSSTSVSEVSRHFLRPGDIVFTAASASVVSAANRKYVDMGYEHARKDVRKKCRNFLAK